MSCYVLLNDHRMNAVFKLLATAFPRAPTTIWSEGFQSPSFESSGAKGLRYLPFVDGLRAVSILAVVAYHIGVPKFPGGFVGVDVFFVISGFLIINQIKSGLSAGQYSIWRFYAQRGLRILPSYFMMLLVVFAAAPFFLPTAEVYWNFVSAALTAPLMVSNIAFYATQGYFDLSGIEKPLLHTWTLSVEEQFYFVAPLLLLLAFRLGGRRFGGLAALIGLFLAVTLFSGAIVETSPTGRNAAFYLPQWRGWEFLIGGFIGSQLVAAVRRFPPVIIELFAWIGAGCIALAIGAFNSTMLYPSWRAAVPVAGAALVILCGTAQPENSIAKLLALRGMVAIGLVSYAWYLWHWPILSFIRILRLGEPSLLPDALGGGILAFMLACMTYYFVERPIGRLRKTPGFITNQRKCVLGFCVACITLALVGAGSALLGYRFTETFVAQRYGIDGKGVIANHCDSKTGFANDCFERPVGILVGDSHATVFTGTITKRFQTMGARLVSMARGGCTPLLLSPSQRTPGRRDGCAVLVGPYERLIRKPSAVSFAIISAIWDPSAFGKRLLSDEIAEFDPNARILLIGPVPMFPTSSLECVVLSDRYGTNRNRCLMPRIAFDTFREGAVEMLRLMTDRYPNVRFIDPVDLFCDRTTCRPFKGNEVLYLDSHHLSPAGADLLFDSFRSDFLWLTGKE